MHHGPTARTRGGQQGRYHDRDQDADARHGVSDGARTRDILDHNQVLYQLSYTHHAVDAGSAAPQAESVYLVGYPV